MKHEMTPYEKRFLDIEISSAYEDIGNIRMIVSMSTALCYYWHNEKYLGRTFSLNQFGDNFVFHNDGNEILIKSMWLPAWKISAYNNGKFKGAKWHLLGSFVFWISNILNVALITAVVIFLYRLLR